MREFIEVLKSRRSVRKYKPVPISKETIEEIIGCARFSPTARNEQPWIFIAVNDKKTLARISKIASPNGEFIKDASWAIAVFCRNTKYYLEDGSSATVYMLLASWAKGIGSCWIAGDKKPYAEEIRKILKVPQDYRLVSLVSLGHPENIPVKEKKPLEEIIFWGEYGKC